MMPIKLGILLQFAKIHPPGITVKPLEGNAPRPVDKNALTKEDRGFRRKDVFAD